MVSHGFDDFKKTLWDGFVQFFDHFRVDLRSGLPNGANQVLSIQKLAVSVHLQFQKVPHVFDDVQVGTPSRPAQNVDFLLLEIVLDHVGRVNGTAARSMTFAEIGPYTTE